MNTQKNLGVLTRGFTQLAIKSCGSEQGRRNRGGGGGQSLLLFQSGGADYAHPITTAPPDFKIIKRSCVGGMLYQLLVVLAFSRHPFDSGSIRYFKN